MCLADGYKTTYARVAQLVEHDLAKVGAAGSSPVSRSLKKRDILNDMSFFVMNPAGLEHSSFYVPFRSSQNRRPPDALRRLALLYSKKKRHLPPDSSSLSNGIIQIIFHCHNFLHWNTFKNRHFHFKFDPEERIHCQDCKRDRGKDPDCIALCGIRRNI